MLSKLGKVNVVLCCCTVAVTVNVMLHLNGRTDVGDGGHEACLVSRTSEPSLVAERPEVERLGEMCRQFFSDFLLRSRPWLSCSQCGSLRIGCSCADQSWTRAICQTRCVTLRCCCLLFCPLQGTARRKKKVVHRTATADDKKLQFSLKKLGVNNISGIEEVSVGLLCSKKVKVVIH